ncbi:MAG: DUF305 domain-containing protein [Cyanobacteriota bacterium]
MMAMTPEVLSEMRIDGDLGLGSADEHFDRRLIEAMLLQGAVSMAKEALQKSQQLEILQLAEAILASQQAEIEQMRGAGLSCRRSWL